MSPHHTTTTPHHITPHHIPHHTPHHTTPHITLHTTPHEGRGKRHACLVEIYSVDVTHVAHCNCVCSFPSLFFLPCRHHKFIYLHTYTHTRTHPTHVSRKGRRRTI